MNLNHNRWMLKNNIDHDSDPADHKKLIYQLLSSRGLKPDEFDGFLNPDLGDLCEPEQLKDLLRAESRLKTAIKRNEKIVIYGDYDVDGMTSISILLKTFKLLAYPVDYYIPDRQEEGYGLNLEAIHGLIQKGANVIVSVDCGITSVNEAVICKEAGVDLIITDHHEPQDTLPDAYALINPKQPGCLYPYKHLAGAGIALRLSEALLGPDFIENSTPLLELAAFGTVADVAPLLGENRILVAHGLITMTETTQVGLRALIEASGMTGKNITAGHIGFILGPKLNAAGRISDPSLGVKLLTSEDPIEASEIAKRLVQTNEERQAIERDIVELAMAQVESKRLDAGPESPLPGFIVVSGKGWHGGVIGIVASRIVERYHRPTVVFGIQDGIAKGSGRSIEGFNLFEALSSVKDLFSKFGGHEQAAGMTLPADKLDDLEARLVTYANSILTEEDFKPIFKIDAVLSRETIHYNLTDALKMLEPHGPGNPKPLFRVNDLCVEKSMRMGRQQEYLKIIASDGPRAFELINFQNPAMLEPLKSKMKFDAVVQIDENEFRGIRSIQFLTKAIRVHDPALYMSETEIEAFNQTKVDALIKKSSADGSDQSQPCSDSTLQNSSQPAGSLTPQRYEAFSLQGYLRYHHRYRDQLSASEGSDAEFCLCPVESVPGTISVDPPEYDMKSETTLSLPDRDELKALYLKIKKNEPLQRPLSLTTLFGLRILEAAALIKAEGDRYQLLEVSGKIDLMASPLLKQLQMWAKA